MTPCPLQVRGHTGQGVAQLTPPWPSAAHRHTFLNIKIICNICIDRDRERTRQGEIGLYNKYFATVSYILPWKSSSQSYTQDIDDPALCSCLSPCIRCWCLYTLDLKYGRITGREREEVLRKQNSMHSRIEMKCIFANPEVNERTFLSPCFGSHIQSSHVVTFMFWKSTTLWDWADSCHQNKHSHLFLTAANPPLTLHGYRHDSGLLWNTFFFYT
jgi:hypothetical protein